jgi:hypothetical protein
VVMVRGRAVGQGRRGDCGADRLAALSESSVRRETSGSVENCGDAMHQVRADLRRYSPGRKPDLRLHPAGQPPVVPGMLSRANCSWLSFAGPRGRGVEQVGHGEVTGPSVCTASSTHARRRRASRRWPTRYSTGRTPGRGLAIAAWRYRAEMRHGSGHGRARLLLVVRGA